MALTARVKEILKNYNGETPAIKSRLAQLLMQGDVGGSGRMIILPVDQGFEHGPDKSFAKNKEAYDPHYLFNLAIDAKLSALAAPYGLLQAGADEFAGAIPLILKMNSANSLHPKSQDPTQALTSSVSDAARLGCIGVGLTLYPGSPSNDHMIEVVKEIAKEARAAGLLLILWSYPRGGDLSKEGETSLDTIAYGAHMAALLGAHIIKVKLPTRHVEKEAIKAAYQENNIAIDSLAERVKHVVLSCLHGRRLVVFSGGEAKDSESIIADAQAIRQGGGHGSIIGRNSFQRAYKDALTLLKKLTDVYKE